MSDQYAELLELERRRCKAITDSDVESLQTILSDDYVHVHATGQVDDRDAHIQTILLRPRSIERYNLTARVYGSVAVLVGEQINHSAGQTMTAVATQVAVNGAGGWQFVSMQVTRSSSPRLASM